MKLRITTADSILQTLDETYFTRVNFDAQFPDGKDDWVVDITFLPNRDFRFRVLKSYRVTFPRNSGHSVKFH